MIPALTERLVSAMSSIPPTGRGDYFEAITAEDERLEATMNAIRADEAAGHLTVREAADNRISALETHITKCQALRLQYLGGDHDSND